MCKHTKFKPSEPFQSYMSEHMIKDLVIEADNSAWFNLAHSLSCLLYYINKSSESYSVIVALTFYLLVLYH